MLRALPGEIAPKLAVAGTAELIGRWLADEALAQSEARYREVVETAHNAILAQLAEGVIVTDATGRITLVNEAAAAIHGELPDHA